MSEQSLKDIEKTLIEAHKEAVKAKAKVDAERAKATELLKAEAEMTIANKTKEDTTTSYRNVLRELYQNTGALPVTEYAQVGIKVTRTLKDRQAIIQRIVSAIADGDQSMLELLNVDDSKLGAYPTLNAEWDIEQSVDARIQWKKME